MIKSIILWTLFIVVSNCDSSNHYLTPQQLSTNLNFTQCFAASDGDSIFRYSIESLNKTNGLIEFEKFRGKAILVLNVATFCRSATDYPQLNQLADKFGKNLVIVGFPSNQFWNQEPGTRDEIWNAIHFVRPGKGFVPKFLLTNKIEVNGAGTHPVFSFLKRSCPSTDLKYADQKYYFWDPKNIRDVRWNFEKFLIDGSNGQPIRRYDTSYDAIKISGDIEELLKKLKKY